MAAGQRPGGKHPAVVPARPATADRPGQGGQPSDRSKGDPEAPSDPPAPPLSGASGATTRGPRRGRPIPTVETEAALADRLHRSALAYLARFSAHRTALATVLTRRALTYAPTLPEAVRACVVAAEVERCAGVGLIDDQAWADARARRLLARGKPAAVVREDLIGRGLPAAVVDRAVVGLSETVGEDPDLAAARAFARRRRLGPYRRDPAIDPTKELAAFARAGFSYRVARAVIGEGTGKDRANDPG